MSVCVLTHIVGTPTAAWVLGAYTASEQPNSHGSSSTAAATRGVLGASGFLARAATASSTAPPPKLWPISTTRRPCGGPSAASPRVPSGVGASISSSCESMRVSSSVRACVCAARHAWSSACSVGRCFVYGTPPSSPELSVKAAEPSRCSGASTIAPCDATSAHKLEYAATQPRRPCEKRTTGQPNDSVQSEDGGSAGAPRRKAAGARMSASGRAKTDASRQFGRSTRRYAAA
mmetsp:Transcript_29947/g.82223  ORF Transcript_29947/g.82223 Transcript_29947/m.82223 type:complete len:233 (-) Transcript_29947:244-942(-)|eukprot:1812111-Prymnesium_polylepis.1